MDRIEKRIHNLVNQYRYKNAKYPNALFLGYKDASDLYDLPYFIYNSANSYMGMTIIELSVERKLIIGDVVWDEN